MLNLELVSVHIEVRRRSAYSDNVVIFHEAWSVACEEGEQT